MSYARTRNLAKVVLGGRRAPAWWRGPTLARRLAATAPDIDRIEVGQA